MSVSILARKGRGPGGVALVLGVFALLVVSSGSSALGATGAARAKTSGAVTIGVIEHLTGPSAYYGTGEVKSIKAAVAYLNSTGGILGKQINLQVLDDADNPAQSVPLVRKFASDSSIPLILGPTNAPSDEADGPIAAQQHIPEIENTGGPSEVKGGWAWIVFAPYPQYAKVVVNTYFSKTHEKTAALVTQSNNVAFTQLVSPIESQLKSLGVKLAANIQYTQGTIDFSSQITQLKAAHPQAVLLDMIDVDAARFMVQARKAGLTARWVVPNNSEATPKLKERAGGSALGLVGPAIFDPKSTTPQFKAYETWIHKLYHADLDPTTINGWDSVILMKQAIVKAGAFDRSKIQAALKSIPGFVGAAGSYKQQLGWQFAQQTIGVVELTKTGYVPWHGQS
jgi:branched-chain amino acid transport system substrate-binding protein